MPPKHAEAKSSTRKPKPFDLDWCLMSWPALQNYLHGAPYLKTIPEGFSLAEMYTSARNPHNPYIPTIMRPSPQNSRPHVVFTDRIRPSTRKD